MIYSPFLDHKSISARNDGIESWTYCHSRLSSWFTGYGGLLLRYKISYRKNLMNLNSYFIL